MNAETKRTAEASGSRRTQLASEGKAHVPLRTVGASGPAQLTTTKGYSTTMAISTLTNLLAKSKLRQGDGVVSRNASFFGAAGMGRLTAARNGAKLCSLEPDYSPKSDTVLKALVRLVCRPRLKY